MLRGSKKLRKEDGRIRMPNDIYSIPKNRLSAKPHLANMKDVPSQVLYLTLSSMLVSILQRFGVEYYE